MSILENIRLKQEHAAFAVLVFVILSIAAVYSSVSSSNEHAKMPYNTEQMYDIDYERSNISATVLGILAVVTFIPALFLVVYFTQDEKEIFFDRVCQE